MKHKPPEQVVCDFDTYCELTERLMIYVKPDDKSWEATEAGAREFVRTHVVVSKSDLQRIRDLVRKHGILDELEALGVTTSELRMDKR